MELDELLLAAALAAAWWLASASLVDGTAARTPRLLDTTSARVAVLLHDAHAVCDHVTAGPRQPAQHDQRASISSRTGLAHAWYACCDCPSPPAPSQTHARDGKRAHGPLTRIRLAGTLAIDAHIDYRMLLLVVYASQVVTLGQHGAASGLIGACCAACGFVCVPRGI